MKIFPERLRALRGEASQRAFAKKFGVSQVAYGRWELGQREPDLEIIQKICETESVSADWLLGLTDTRTGGVSVTASGGSVAANHSTVSTSSPTSPSTPPETSRLLGIIESQQRIIENLSRPDGGKKRPT